MEYVYAGSLIKTIYLIFNHLIYWACFSLEWKECQTLFIALIWYKLCISAAISKSQNRSSFFLRKIVYFLCTLPPYFWISIHHFEYPEGPNIPIIWPGPIQIETSLHFVWILVSVQAGPTRTDSKEFFSHKVLGTRQEILSQRSFSSDLTFKLFL